MICLAPEEACLVGGMQFVLLPGKVSSKKVWFPPPPLSPKSQYKSNIRGFLAWLAFPVE